MANYQESTIAGTKYKRAYQALVNNGITRKGITFHEEEIVTLDDGETITKKAGEISEAFAPDNAQKAFPMLNPETGEAIDGATMTYEGVYVALYSLYLHLATERDAYVAQLAVAEPEASVDVSAGGTMEGEATVV